MSALTLLVLRFGFLLLLWLFILGIVYALRSDLFGARTRKPQTSPQVASFPSAHAAPSQAAHSAAPATSPVSTPTTGPLATTATAHSLVITSGPRAGTELRLGREPLTIGRSAESGLVIRDDYTSTHHARLVLWDDTWMIQDLDSTNGTLLDGRRVSVPTPVPLDTPVKIGTTSFELRR